MKTGILHPPRSPAPSPNPICCQSPHNGRLLTAALISLAFWLPIALPSQAQPAAATVAEPAQPPRWNRVASSNQLNAVKLAEEQGIRVEWHQDLGTPRSIRGTQLDRSAAWSNPGTRLVAATERPEERAFGVLANLARVYQMSEPRQEMRFKRTEGDTLGYQHVRMEQVYQGLRVVGGDLIVHFNKEGQAYQVNGEYVADIQAGLTPQITAEEAVRLAQTNLVAMGMPAGEVDDGPEQVIFALNHEPELAWQLQLSYQDTQIGPGQWRYWVSARSGEVVLRYDNIQRIDAPTTNGVSATITGYLMEGEGGNKVSFTGWRENTSYYYLRDTNLAFCIFNSGTNGFPDDGTYAWRSSSDWGRSDRDEISAANNFAIVERYYRDVHGRNSYDNLGSYINVYVHDLAKTSSGGTYWPGERRITLQDGDGILSANNTSLDLCGHEFTHGVTEYSANLVYANESGALNEAFSDIFGTCIEFYAQPDGRSVYPCSSPGRADWLIMEDSATTVNAAMDFRNPRRVGCPSAYRGSAWFTLASDNGGVHFNCAVQEFFFYLLSEGGSGINDGITYNVTGIGITNAQKVAYRTLTVYCTSSTDYNAVRSAWISAAMDLNPNWVANVRAAWAAVHLSDFLQVTAPQNQIVLIGSNATFSVAAKGATPTGYQWWKDGNPIPGANGASFVISSAQAAEEGNYSAVVTSASGVVTSSVAYLEVSTGPRLIAWGGANSGMLASIPSNTGGLVSLATGGWWNYGLMKDGSLAAWTWNAPGNVVPVAPPGSPSDVAAIAAGGSCGLALRTNGTVFGWGFNDEGQTSVPPSLSNVVAMSAAANISLLLTDDGKVFGYGGKNTGSIFYKLTVPEGLDHVVAVSTAQDNWMALKDDGVVVNLGTFGGAYINPTPQLTNAVAISAGMNHNLALKADGTVAAWPASAQTGIPSGLSNVVAISAGYYVNGQNWSMALKADGTVVAWGDNFYHQKDIPAGLSNVVAISAGAVGANGGYDCGYALVGSGAPFIQPLPMRRVVSPGRKTFFYASATGQPPMVYQWYHDGVAMIGSKNALLNLDVSGIADAGNYWLAVSNSLGTATSSVVALAVPNAPFIEVPPADHTIFPGGTDVLSVSAGGLGPFNYQWYSDQTAILGATNSTLVLNNLMANQTGISVVISNQNGVVQTAPSAAALVPVAAWGNNDYGQCSVPASMTNVVAIAGGRYHTLALRDDGTVAAWGAGLPNGPFILDGSSIYLVNQRQSVIPRALANVKAIAAGRYFSLALMNDGTMSSWGSVGGIGSGSGVAVLSMLNGVSAISAGQFHWLALMTNGTVVASNSTPPATLFGVKAISAGYGYSLALLSNSTVVAWGDNTYGQTDVPAGLSNVVAINAGYSTALALKADGTVTAWGRSSYGQLDVPAGLSNVVAISGSTAFLALNKDGTVVAWGGTGTEAYGQANVPVGLTNVTAIASNGRHSLALVRMPSTTPSDTPVFQPLTRSGNTLSLNWSAISGRNYEVQYKTDLTQPDWLHLANVTATNPTATAPDTITTDPQRFYRIVLLP